MNGLQMVSNVFPVKWIEIGHPNEMIDVNVVAGHGVQFLVIGRAEETIDACN